MRDACMCRIFKKSILLSCLNMKMSRLMLIVRMTQSLTVSPLFKKISAFDVKMCYSSLYFVEKAQTSLLRTKSGLPLEGSVVQALLIEKKIYLRNERRKKKNLEMSRPVCLL